MMQIPKQVDISLGIRYNGCDCESHGGLRVYRLLIVTRDPRVEAMFDSMQGWETIGFKQPRLRKTFTEAVECMRKHHIDAIAVDNDPEFAQLNQWRDASAPNLPIFEIAPDADAQMEIVREIELLLNQLHTDDSNDDYDESYYFKQARERWMKRLISGLAPSAAYVFSRQRLYRCPDDAAAPCVFARMTVPEGDAFITGRWHYGSERLGTALQNFFGEEHDHCLLHVAVVSPVEVRAVACQRLGDAEHPVSLPKMQAYFQETLEQIQNYLGLSMTIAEIGLKDGLTAFACECAKSDANG